MQRYERRLTLTGLKHCDLNQISIRPVLQSVQHIGPLTGGKRMPRLEYPKCKEGLDEIVRVIEVRCRYDEADDDYINETGGDRVIDLCPTCKAELQPL